MKKTLILIAIASIAIGKGYAQEQHQIEYDKFERTILKKDSTLLARNFVLNSKLRTENNLDRRRSMEYEIHENCKELKKNVDLINQYVGRKMKELGEYHHGLVMSLKSINLDLEK